MHPNHPWSFLAMVDDHEMAASAQVHLTGGIFLALTFLLDHILWTWLAHSLLLWIPLHVLLRWVMPVVIELIYWRHAAGVTRRS